MMVEAGGTEKSWSYYEAGAPKVTEEVLAAGLEASKQWIRESINLQRQLVEAYTAARGPDRDHPLLDLHRLRGRRVGPGRGGGTDAIAKANLVTSKAERNAALDAAGDEIKAALGDEFAERAGEVKAAIRAADQEAGAQAHRRGRRPRRRPRHGGHPPAVGRGRPVPDGARLGALPAWRDPGAQRDHARHAPHEPAARHHHPGRVEALHAPLQLPAVLDR